MEKERVHVECKREKERERDVKLLCSSRSVGWWGGGWEDWGAGIEEEWRGAERGNERY